MNRKMLCPYCKHTFTITEYQYYNNTRFKCRHCKKYNEGSISSEDGVLIGITIENLKQLEADFKRSQRMEVI